MNSIVLKQLSDLETIAHAPIFLQNCDMHREGVYENMYSLSCTPEFAQKITAEIMLDFVSELLQEKEAQAKRMRYSATLYLWFDEQTTELRFNIIPGHRSQLPFGCKLKFEDSAEVIIAQFVTHRKDRTIPFEEIDFLNEDCHEDNDDACSYELPVFVQYLN